MNDAPLYDSVADGPEGGAAFWLTAADGVRLRVGLWSHDGAQGTVLLLPGRTEYVEKYGRAAGDLRARGFATLVIDWRGQGLADRVFDDVMSGHVGHFDEYQLDFNEMVGFARAKGLPEPYYLMAHSMGGCIGLRALMNNASTKNAPIKAASFSAPMWGILIAAWMRPMAAALTSASRWFKFDGRYAPGTGAKTYVLTAPFNANTLTTDAEMWDYMRQQALAHPELCLGGPSLGWLKAALTECHALTLLASPAVPAVTALGTQEKIVDTAPIHARMSVWKNGTLDMYPGAEHEVMMERAATRGRYFDTAAALFSKHR
ncbi:alpha/beta fold hydrolase [Cypionkella sp.]|uniref:alpha/beta fold hydrolase n=1 Tax=Cypionkella sp. TaxID=2811411 RepID=UPI00261E38EC|nr:alpha/beta hydrolase [Cypionkella sp.]MDB5663462.1 alpha/beta hydrolase [Cypionkella sp.]